MAQVSASEEKKVQTNVREVEPSDPFSEMNFDTLRLGSHFDNVKLDVVEVRGSAIESPKVTLMVSCDFGTELLLEHFGHRWDTDGVKGVLFVSMSFSLVLRWCGQ